ncbi:MAG: hypothetical protein KF699_11390 [Phycisphaeraceae bacterium]|nr:hypothetical protein [Phycisphaeraceae bacterium]
MAVLSVRFGCACVLLAAAGTAGADVRTFDGTGNNVLNPAWGCLDSPLIRGASGAHYMDGLGMMMPRANPRLASNALSAQTPAGLGNSRGLSSMFWQWGQFIDHDFALVDEGSEFAPITIPAGDPVFDPFNTGTATMPFHRSACIEGVMSPRQHTNALTHWIDASMVYGSDATRAAALRSGMNGRLATSAGDMLPFNTAGLPNGGDLGAAGYLAGDIRANEQTGLTAMHTLFVREHNRLADIIAANNPGWNDEQIYQHARRIVAAEVQAITYNEWLPSLLGGHGLGSYAGYDDQVNPSINTAFSTAAFRFGHTMLNDQLLRFNEDGTPYAGGHLNLFQAFFNPATMATSADLAAVIRGLAAQEANEIDTQAIDGVRNLLFGPGMGRDLIALNLQRGRDHGLPDYNTLREDNGLVRVADFSDITSDPVLAAALAGVYGDVDSIDPWIGLMAEDHLPGASVGATMAAIFRDQFGRLRDGDRFFYLNDGELGAFELSFLEGLTLADIIRLNTDAQSIQDNVFFIIPAPGTGAVLAVLGLAAARRRRSERAR